MKPATKFSPFSAFEKAIYDAVRCRSHQINFIPFSRRHYTLINPFVKLVERAVQ